MNQSDELSTIGEKKWYLNSNALLYSVSSRLEERVRKLLGVFGCMLGDDAREVVRFDCNPRCRGRAFSIYIDACAWSAESGKAMALM